MIIAVVGQKGGVGKTTIAVSVAGELARLGHNTLLIDADPQESSYAWWEVAPDKANWPDVTKHIEPNFHDDAALPLLATQYDHIVIDGPPRHGEISRSILMACDLALIPMRPSPLDLRAQYAAILIVGEAMQINRYLHPCLVISQQRSNTILGREIEQALAQPPFDACHLLKASISQAVALAECPINGALINEYKPNSKSDKEVRRLTKEILEYEPGQKKTSQIKKARHRKKSR